MRRFRPGSCKPRLSRYSIASSDSSSESSASIFAQITQMSAFSVFAYSRSAATCGLFPPSGKSSSATLATYMTGLAVRRRSSRCARARTTGSWNVNVRAGRASFKWGSRPSTTSRSSLSSFTVFAFLRILSTRFSSVCRSDKASSVLMARRSSMASTRPST